MGITMIVDEIRPWVDNALEKKSSFWLLMAKYR
jgi:hypothetical protein